MKFKPQIDEETKETVGAESLIEKYNFDAFLIPKSRPLYSYLLTQTDKYKLVYEDEDTVYFRVAE